MIKTLQNLKNLTGPILLHVATVKGKGFEPAEGDPSRYHGVGKFDKVTGKLARKAPGRPAYTSVFGDTMVELGHKDHRVVAITAAMASGTGVVEFSREFPDRFFDVGIAEGHACCFAGGLAAAGARPYVVVYSTFMQRAYDQVIHDIALQKLPVVFCMDRAGLVGDDGPTHHGVFDLSFMSAVPNLTVAAPKDGNEMRGMLHYTADNDLDGPVAIRYPRAEIPSDMRTEIPDIHWGSWELLTQMGEVVILAVGTMVTTAMQAATRLREKGLAVAVINARFVKPMDMEMLDRVRSRAGVVVTIEENALSGGFGQAVAGYLLGEGFDGRFKALGIPDEFVTHGNRARLLTDLGLDVDGVVQSVAEQAFPVSKNDVGFLQKYIFRKNGHHKKRNHDDKKTMAAVNKD